MIPHPGNSSIFFLNWRNTFARAPLQSQCALGTDRYALNASGAQILVHTTDKNGTRRHVGDSQFFHPAQNSTRTGAAVKDIPGFTLGVGHEVNQPGLADAARRSPAGEGAQFGSLPKLLARRL